MAHRAEPGPDRAARRAGNPGIAALGRCHPVRADDADGLLSLALTLEADLVVIGPEAPLVAGVADVLRRNGIAVFGPERGGRADRRIEGVREGRAAGGRRADRGDAVGRAAAVRRQGRRARRRQGRVRLPDDRGVDAALRAVSALGGAFVIEELLDGRGGLALRALRRQARSSPLGAAQDYKRIGDGDAGPNTGGMGAYSPVAWLDGADELVEQVHQPVVDELARRGTPFVGCLFAGLMMTADGPQGARVQRPLRRSRDAGAAAAARGRPARSCSRPPRAAICRRRAPSLSDDAAVTVVLAGPDYPERSDYAGAADHRARRGRGDRRARLPRRHGGTRRHAWSRTAAESSP